MSDSDRPAGRVIEFRNGLNASPAAALRLFAQLGPRRRQVVVEIMQELLEGQRQRADGDEP